jgi:hypothetical protein
MVAIYKKIRVYSLTLNSNKFEILKNYLKKIKNESTFSKSKFA